MKAWPGGLQQWPHSLKFGDSNAKQRWSIRHLLSAQCLHRLSFVNSANELKFGVAFPGVEPMRATVTARQTARFAFAISAWAKVPSVRPARID